MKSIKRFFVISMCIVLVCVILSMSVSASVSEQEHPNEGSISITLKHNNQSISNGTICIYKAADIGSNKSQPYKAVADLSSSGITFDKLDSASSIYLSDYLINNGLNGIEKKADKNGKIYYGNLSLGLYIVYQKEAIPGYKRITPFYICIPQNQSGHINYDIVAEPKIEKVSNNVTPTFPDDRPKDKLLPKTGQLKWPIPVFASLGLFLCIVGWLIIIKIKNNSKK